jgi:phospholipid/cholesterol/gamma-HCH transport system substrate-binding protein
MSTTSRARSGRIVAVLAGAMLLGGCAGEGLSALPLPFRSGTGDDAYHVTVHMADLGNLVPNADVKVGDITVGTVSEVAFDNWTAKLTVSLEPSASLPANAEARVGQKSLLGAEYLELAPPTRHPATGTLRDGDDIPIQRTGHYPATEEMLAALSALLNQGGVGQLQTITKELNDALGGREGDARALLQNVSTLASTLNDRKDDITRALENVDRLTATLSGQNKVIDSALGSIPPGLAALERQRTTLVQTLSSVSAFGDVASRVINESKTDLRANLQALQPLLGELANSGTDLAGSMGMLFTFPFPTNNSFPVVLNGDYGNLYVTIDIDVRNLSNNLLHGLSIAGVPLLGGSSLAGGLVNSNPLTSGLSNLIPPLTQPPGPNPAPPNLLPNGQNGGFLGWLLDTLIPGGR